MMKMNLQKINYQKELEKLLTRLEKEEKKYQLFYCIVAAHRAVVMY